MNRVAATVNAFAVSAVVSAVAFVIAGAARSGSADILDMAAWALVYLWYSSLATVLIAVPLFLVVARLGLISLWSTVAGGVLVGASVAIAIGGFNRPHAYVLVLCCGIGLVAALSFWVTKNLLESKSAPQSDVERAL